MKRNITRQEERRMAMFQASPISTHPLGGRLTLHRELGCTRVNIVDAIHGTWARGLVRRTVFTNQAPKHPERKIMHFVRDSETGGFMYSLCMLWGEPYYIWYTRSFMTRNFRYRILMFIVGESCLLSFQRKKSRLQQHPIESKGYLEIIGWSRRWPHRR